MLRMILMERVVYKASFALSGNKRVLEHSVISVALLRNGEVEARQKPLESTERRLSDLLRVSSEKSIIQFQE